jgi:hypothetical protein
MGTKVRKAAITLAKHEARPLPIVADAAIAAEVFADGRLVPVLIVDTSERPDIDQLVRAHEFVAPGDVDTTWMRRPGKDRLSSVSLLLEFKRPVSCNVILEFSLPDMIPIVDLIVGARALYIQPGRPGDRLATTIRSPKIIADVPSDDFSPAWDEILPRCLEREFRRRGLLKREARKAAAEHIRTGRQLRYARLFPREGESRG